VTRNVHIRNKQTVCLDQHLHNTLNSSSCLVLINWSLHYLLLHLLTMSLRKYQQIADLPSAGRQGVDLRVGVAMSKIMPSSTSLPSMCILQSWAVNQRYVCTDARIYKIFVASPWHVTRWILSWNFSAMGILLFIGLSSLTFYQWRVLSSYIGRTSYGYVVSKKIEISQNSVKWKKNRERSMCC
jgi:hypothetical protein